MNGRHGRRFSTMCATIHRVAQESDPMTGPERGWRWERRIARALLLQGFYIRSLPAGALVHGAHAASGLRHQIDAEIQCEHAFIIGEWKAFSGLIPKNEVLLFKAISDDIYEDFSPRQRRVPVFRVFGANGDGCIELRRYAARHGMALVEKSRWPAPVLADPELHWPRGESPSDADRKRLAWLCRPMQLAADVGSDGFRTLRPPMNGAAIDSLLSLQERWSARLSRLVAAGFVLRFGPIELAS